MEDYRTVFDQIRAEITQDIADVRESFLKEFGHQVNKFIELMTKAFINWRSIDSSIGIDEKKGHVAALVYSAITLHILSMKLFLSGHIVASGNLERQVLETIALALLCSSKSLTVLERYMAQKYSTQKAVDEAIKHSKMLDINKKAIEGLKRAHEFYHKYSHPTLLTIVSHVSFSVDSGLYVGASFDEGKLENYKKEVMNRIGLANVFNSFIEAVKSNLARW
jgi:hypothetical protein